MSRIRAGRVIAGVATGLFLNVALVTVGMLLRDYEYFRAHPEHDAYFQVTSLRDAINLCPLYFVLLSIMVGPGSLMLGVLISLLVAVRRPRFWISRGWDCVILGIPAGLLNLWLASIIWAERMGGDRMHLIGAIGGIGLGVGVALFPPRVRSPSLPQAMAR